MGNLLQGLGHYAGSPQPVHYAPPPVYTQPQLVQQSYPPAPKVQTQSQPTEISLAGLKYNAINVDKLSLNITSRQGFDGVTPDMMIWNTYQYNVTDLKANANENELSGFLNWSMQSTGIQDIKVDFHPGQRVTLSGKYPLMGVPIPFTADVSLMITPHQQVLLTIDEFKTGFRVPDKMRDTLIDLLVKNEGPHQGPPPASPGEAFAFSDALRKVGNNQILIDFGRMKTPLNLPIQQLQTTQNGFSVVGGVSVAQSSKAVGH
ncbi:MAG: hypothetical protein IGS03_11230 [Candidatus Sericytochromatia bacterium]|nr:hypothetical protein [Candidatus Sericytochromatia bacterium]